MKMQFILLVFLTAAVQKVVSLYTPGCTDIACAAVYIPPECRFPTFAIENGQVCRSCDVNICDQLPPIFGEMAHIFPFCPNIACPKIYIRPECRLHTFLIYKSSVCRGCDQDICRFG
ncbi:hypothetical protein CHS0354_037949 [Potamilus streckersoni]|uniref:Uncharacterized protein n=1 Tax=Potamilus streckersoni TaxID=2493646 RepID=A0AAE0TA83_9BIVA|nr:hypothetical protein CHS0354_037949 [Potamilus streckersoni]